MSDAANRFPRRRAASPCAVAALAAAIALLGSGCSPDARSALRYQLEVPSGWKPVPTGQAPEVLGRRLEAWEIPTIGGLKGSLVVTRSEYQPDVTAPQLLVHTRNLTRTLSTTVRLVDDREVSLGDTRAALVGVVAEGTGSALAPTGLGVPYPRPGTELIPTRRLWLRAPRGPDLGTLEVFFHCPEAAWPELQGAWETMLRSIRA